MKKAILVLGFTLVTLTSAFAQRFAYVDSEFILKHMPEYSSAQKQIEALSVQWQKEVDQRFQEIDRLYKAYQADQVLMTADMKKRREAEIADKEKTAKDFQRQKFGPLRIGVDPCASGRLARGDQEISGSAGAQAGPQADLHESRAAARRAE